MATWRFELPARSDFAYALDDAAFTLFGRARRNRPGVLVRKADATTWEELPALPMTQNPGAKYLHGYRGFSNADSQQSTYDIPTRLYLGGHVYHINDAQKAELEAAVTSFEATGYDAYITSSSEAYTGDEIIASGYTADYDS